MSLTRTKSQLPPPGVYQITDGTWKEVTTKQGKEQIHWYLDLEDLDGQPQPLSLYATDQQYASVNKQGKLTNIDGGDASISSRMAAGMFMDSLEDHGFSGRKLKDIDANPDCAKGTWIKLGHVASDQVDGNGKPYVNVLVEDVLDGKPSGKGKNTTTTKKVVKSSDEEEEEEEETATSSDEEEEESDDLDASDDEIEAAVEFVKAAVADPDTYVKNFDAEENDGGITLKQANTAVFSKFKGKGALKGKVATLVGNPKFHEMYADGWTFDADEGVVSPKKAKKATKK